jgi:hypothetical protein
LVVAITAGFNGLHFVLPGNAARKRPEPVTQFRRMSRRSLELKTQWK